MPSMHSIQLNPQIDRQSAGLLIALGLLPNQLKVQLPFFGVGAD